jgi:hypothetical protein
MLRIARSSFGQIRDFGFVAIFVVTASLNNSAAGQNQAPTLDWPSARTVGDTFTFDWHYQNVVRTYIGQKNGLNCYSDKAADGRQSEECFTWDDNLVRRVGTWEPMELTPSSGQLSFPLFVGKQWASSYTRLDAVQRWWSRQTDIGRTHPRYSVIARVVSYEKVTVPAGTFDAFKILATGTRWGDIGTKDIIEYYSPNVGMIKFDEFGIRWGYKSEEHVKLISFSLAKPGS